MSKHLSDFLYRVTDRSACSAQITMGWFKSACIGKQANARYEIPSPGRPFCPPRSLLFKLRLANTPALERKIRIVTNAVALFQSHAILKLCRSCLFMNLALDRITDPYSAAGSRLNFCSFQSRPNISWNNPRGYAQFISRISPVEFVLFTLLNCLSNHTVTCRCVLRCCGKARYTTDYRQLCEQLSDWVCYGTHLLVALQAFQVYHVPLCVEQRLSASLSLSPPPPRAPSGSWGVW